MNDRAEHPEPIRFPVERTRQPDDTPERTPEQPASQESLNLLYDEMTTLLPHQESMEETQDDTARNRRLGVVVDYDKTEQALNYHILIREVAPDNHLKFVERFDIVTLKRDPQTNAVTYEYSSSYAPGQYVRIPKPGGAVGEMIWGEQDDGVAARKHIVDPVLTEEVYADHMRLARAEVNRRASQKRALIVSVDNLPTAADA